MSKRLALVLISAIGSSAMPSAAHAISVAAEIGPQIAFGDWVVGDDKVGVGLAGRIGWPIKLPLLKISPELKVGYDSLPNSNPFTGASLPITMIRVMGGARVTLLEGFSPIAFAHIGYGSGSTEGSDSKGGLAIDVGAGLDFTLLPIIDVGAFVAYNRVTLSDPDTQITYITVGATAALSF